MDRKKRFTIKVAKKTWASELPIVVVHIPWDQFQAPGGPAAYALLIEGTGSIAGVVSKPAGGAWSSSTKIEKAWATISEATPLDSLEWHTIPIESDHYPWELFQR